MATHAVTQAARRSSDSRGGGATGCLRVLTYHRVAEVDEASPLDPRLISATPAAFARQMDYVARYYPVVSLSEVVGAVAGDGTVPAGATLITFDDGYRELRDHAFPILRRLGLPATVFVPTAFAADPELSFWWDRVYRALVTASRSAIEHPAVGLIRLGPRAQRLETIHRLQDYVVALPHDQAMRVVGEICAEAKGAPPARGSVLSWREIREAGAMSIGVAAHARTHPVLTMLPIEAARREIRESLADIERETGTAADAFCYPNGSASDAVVGAVSEAGVTVAFTTRNGHNDLRRADPLRLARQHISMRSSLPVFRARLSMFGGRVDTWRSRFVPGV